MIEADIRRKYGSEDIFTSNCIGLLGLLPDRFLLDFLGKSVNLAGNQLNLISSSSIQSIDFWPAFLSGYPDVVVKFKDGTILIIEIKHGAGKHGSDLKSGDSNDDKVSVDEENKKTRDQLAKYWCDAQKMYNLGAKIILIYLTHHRSIPIGDLEESEKSAEKYCGGSNFYWLNWFTLFARVHDWICTTGSCYSQKKILELLSRYLISKGYICFLEWGLLPKNTVEFRPYNRVYHNLGSIDFSESYFFYQYIRKYESIVSGKFSINYNRLYNFCISITSEKSFCFYSPEGDKL